ncbi:hypothetical protein SBA5_490060 [Candidatus Sulfotelmatomonas gaucii]|uniref:Uncharacterized protein n=1 Tax=Candidatus Sulfuritelmatomonas gaucii TaxID=2043161 RepID=A0A2N9LQB4_9BACT|nr:hypothetical protein SBA5_490060 [Candidatus Sulfotelmatomonas gaucii]
MSLAVQSLVVSCEFVAQALVLTVNTFVPPDQTPTTLHPYSAKSHTV